MKLIYLKSALKFDSLYVFIGTKIPFSRVSITIEPGHSLLRVRYQELFGFKIEVRLTLLLDLKFSSWGFHP
jgi:hypothetical protein